MEEIKNKVRDFLKANGMDYQDIVMQDICDRFLDEMDKGLAAEESSLKMLTTYIETERDIPKNKPVIVMDAGGTNFRVATVTFRKDGNADIQNFHKFQMPGLKEEVGKDKFFGTMAGYISQVVNQSKDIGFCFSYPIEMFPNKDGRVLYFSKEIQASEVVGQMIGESLNVAISAAGFKADKNVVLLNDTVATLLAGRAESTGRVFDSYIGFILGTGTNTSYIEKNSNITREQGLDSSKSQIINIESGAFGKAPRGAIDIKLDKESVSPGVNIFEKMISGAYLGPTCFNTIKSAIFESLFTKRACEQLAKLEELSTKDVSDFLFNPIAGDSPLSSAIKGASQDDIAALYYLIDMLVERAAKLTAVNLSSVCIKSGKGENPSQPICIVAEGTTFYNLKSLRQKTEYYLKQYLVDQKIIYYEIVTIENATLIGAAIAGLTN